MEITWYGQSCFRLKIRNATVVTDPCSKEVGYTIPRLRADLVTISYNHPDYSNCALIQGDAKIINGPGEYEAKGVFVTGIATDLKKSKGPERLKNTIYLFDFEGLTVCHLGVLDHIPSQAQLQALSDVDILLIPVGGVTTINANQAAEMIGLLEPRIVIPMHYKTKVIQAKLDTVSKFLKEMGVSEPTPSKTLEINKSRLPTETQVVVLNHKG
ncbi:MAG: MBL fold metallo-hydrolase [Chloroflexi bacterium]|nr:MBL fold metallo-hydrolase [Chloroflexota bacterium]